MAKKSYWVIGLIVLGHLIGFLVVFGPRENSQEVLNKYLEAYRDSLETRLNMNAGDFLPLEARLTRSPGTVSNFEGPRITLEGLRFHDTWYDKPLPGHLHLDGVSANFDPDHPYMGLPNLSVKVGPVRLHEPDKGRLEGFLGSKSDPVPYRVYRKKISREGEQGNKILEMQLWLTEFNVTLDINPDRQSPPIGISREEKNQSKYPGKWYGSSKEWILLDELEKEYRNQRYGDLGIVLKIVTDNSPWYLDIEGLKAVKPDFAVAAVYCSGLQVVQEIQEKRVSPAIQQGMAMYLHETNQAKEPTRHDPMTGDLHLLATQLLDAANSKTQQSIWNKPYYLELYFNNIGSWKEGFLGNRRYDDQVNYTFLMPVFVVGSWDVIPPASMIPKWSPPAAYNKRFGLGGLLSVFTPEKKNRWILIAMVALTFTLIFLWRRRK